MIDMSYNKVLDRTPLSVFEPIIQCLRQSNTKKIIPLHQGKTVFTTPVDLRNWEQGEFDNLPYHDGPTCGSEQLIIGICEDLQGKFNEQIAPTRIQVTCGITHALSIVFHCILSPLDEIIVLSPHWLFVNGLIQSAGGVAVEAPFFPATSTEQSERPSLGPHCNLESYLTPKTRGIYFNTPNNPTGCSLSRSQIEDIGNLARRHDLWIISDNAYEYYDYTIGGFVDPVTLEATKDRTFSAYSFSKSFGLTGYRIGYLLSPPDMAPIVRKFGLYSIYSVPTVCQFIALSALRGGAKFWHKHRNFVQDALKLTIDQLRIPATIPDGGFYTFLDLSKWKKGVDDFISRCISEGVSLAPGGAFGVQYNLFARLCYSGVSHEDLDEGIRIINKIYDGT